MLISGELQVGEKIAARDEDSIIAAMNKAAIGADEEETPQDKNGIGQIRVELMRVKLGEKWEDEDYHAKHKEGEAEDVKMDGVDQVSHTTGLVNYNRAPVFANWWKFNSRQCSTLQIGTGGKLHTI